MDEGEKNGAQHPAHYKAGSKTFKKGKPKHWREYKAKTIKRFLFVRGPEWFLEEFLYQTKDYDVWHNHYPIPFASLKRIMMPLMNLLIKQYNI